jgi:Protein of unknown function (DUF2914)
VSYNRGMKNVGFFESAPITFVRKHWLTVAFLLGFVTDFLLLNQVDNKVDNFILFFYVILASVSLILFYVGVAEKAPAFLVRFFNKFMPILMQYSFGGLLSGMLIFYGRSGDLMVSAPFLILIIGIILINELVKKRSDRLLYNVTVYFIGILSYLVLMVPVWIGQMGDFVFVGSGLLSLVVMVLMVKILSWVIPNFLVLEKRLIVFSIGSLYILFNSFYFLNIIPPIPLSITELSIYQQIESTDLGGYRITAEKKEWWQKIPLVPMVFNPISGKGAYCFARVYAPTTLKTDIVHRWEYRDANGIWQNHFTKKYSISGENKNGYRGYTMIENIRDGVWRCSVETVRGQVLGRRTFTVDTKKQPTALVTVVE